MTKDEIKNKIRICHRFIKPGYWRIRKPELIQILNIIGFNFDKVNLKPRGNKQLSIAINMLAGADLIRWNGNHVFWLTSKFWTLNF